MKFQILIVALAAVASAAPLDARSAGHHGKSVGHHNSTEVHHKSGHHHKNGTHTPKQKPHPVRVRNYQLPIPTRLSRTSQLNNYFDIGRS